MTREVAGVRFEVRWGAATDTGLVRDHNEDSYLAAPPVFLVADGMGGHSRGEAASGLAVQVFEQLAGADWLEASALNQAVQQAAASVAALQQGTSAPGTTLAGVGLNLQTGRPYWLIFNIGDSRVYLLRGGGLEQVTVDHSRVQELREAGLDSAWVGRNVITRALGGGGRALPTADQWLVPAQQGDRVLVCSDGLTSEVSDLLVTATLLSEPDPQAAARALVAAAKAAGGRDNITTVVVDAVAVGGSAAAEPDDDTLTGSVWDEPDDDTLESPLEEGSADGQ